MEVKLDKRYPVAASLDQAWAVLGDIRATAACMPGAQITEQIDATHFKGTVKSKVGPAVMSFGGDIELQGLDTAAKSLQMLGKGADKAGSSASMQLSAHLEAGEDPTQSVLVGQATIIVSGKLAQFGSRLLVPVSDAMLAQFAANFSEAAAAVPVVAAVAAASNATAATPGTGAAAHSAATHSAATPNATAHASGASNANPPRVAAPVKELNALGLMWTVFKGWLAGLFGAKK
jgi:uncharacterized protein